MPSPIFAHHFNKRDSLRGGRPWDRGPVRAKFSAPAQTGPGAHSALYAMDIWSLPGGVALANHHPTFEDVKERVMLWLRTPSGSLW